MIDLADPLQFIPWGTDRMGAWCRLHTWHALALANLDDVRRLRAAPYIADAKYRVYLGQAVTK